MVFYKIGFFANNFNLKRLRETIWRRGSFWIPRRSLDPQLWIIHSMITYAIILKTDITNWFQEADFKQCNLIRLCVQHCNVGCMKWYIQSNKKVTWHVYLHSISIWTRRNIQFCTMMRYDWESHNWMFCAVDQIKHNTISCLLWSAAFKLSRSGGMATTNWDGHCKYTTNKFKAILFPNLKTIMLMIYGW